MGQLNVNKLWDFGYGGYADDVCNDFHITKDSGFVLAGFTHSDVGGDIGQPNRGIGDFWLVKLNNQGLLDWERRFGGGGLEGATKVRQTKDGGFLLGGYCSSGLSGDKTQPSQGGYDYWVVKTDGQGNKLWDKRYGGLSGDYMWAMTLTADGGALLGGYSESGVGGDKTEPNRGIFEDYWVVKIDSSGNKEWDRTLGGSLSDFCDDIIQTKDGGFLIGGISRSDSSGDKSENNWGTGNDYWVVKLDSNGNKLWDKTLGTNSNDTWFFKCFENTRGNYMIISGAVAGISGNKAIEKGGAWIVELNDLGNKVREFSITGPDVTYFSEVENGNYIIGGGAYADTSADKSEFGLGTLFVKIDSIGNRIWDKTIVANAGGIGAITLDNCYATAGSLKDPPNGYQTATNWDSNYATEDFWIMKFCLDATDGVGMVKDESKMLSVYPNPASEFITVDYGYTNWSKGDAELQIVNSIGQTVYEQKLLSYSAFQKIDVSHFANGVYLVTLKRKGQLIAKAKFVKD